MPPEKYLRAIFSRRRPFPLHIANMAASSELSPFRAKNIMNAAVLVKEHPKWSTPTCLLRILTEKGTELPVIASGPALKAVESVVEARSYEMTIPGAASKQNKDGLNNGCISTHEVRIKTNFPVKPTLKM